jgi:hypothetical protein
LPKLKSTPVGAVEAAGEVAVVAVAPERAAAAVVADSRRRRDVLPAPRPGLAPQPGPVPQPLVPALQWPALGPVRRLLVPVRRLVLVRRRALPALVPALRMSLEAAVRRLAR